MVYGGDELHLRESEGVLVKIEADLELSISVGRVSGAINYDLPLAALLGVWLDGDILDRVLHKLLVFVVQSVHFLGLWDLIRPEAEIVDEAQIINSEFRTKIFINI